MFKTSCEPEHPFPSLSLSIMSALETAGSTCRGATHDVEVDHHAGSDATALKIAQRRQHGWRRLVRNFTPSWFSVNMGTGITSILLHNLPYNAAWLRYISYILFALNVILFITFLVISLLRYTIYPKIWTAMIRHPAQSLFLGTFPMGLATIINMTVFVCVPVWGGNWWKVAWALWWIDSAISLCCCLYLPFVVWVIHLSPRILCC
jgi:hypothetical protein